MYLCCNLPRNATPLYQAPVGVLHCSGPRRLFPGIMVSQFEKSHVYDLFPERERESLGTGCRFRT